MVDTDEMLDSNLMRYPVKGRERGFMPGWEPARTKNNVERVVLEACIEQIERFRIADVLPTTPRTLMYRLWAGGLVHPKLGIRYSDMGAKVGKARLSGTIGDVLSKARRAGIISWNDIEDGRISASVPIMYGDEAAFLDVLKDDIEASMPDLSEGQPVRQELFMEAKGSMRLLERICKDERGISVYSAGGDPSVRAQRLTAQRAVYDWRENERPQIVWQIGDFDGGGVTNFHAFADNVYAFAHALEPSIIDNLSVVRLMLNEVQAMDTAFVDLTGREKLSRTAKATNWPATPDWTAQLEAVDPVVMRDEVVRQLDSHLDLDLLVDKKAEWEEIQDSIFTRLGLTR